MLELADVHVVFEDFESEQLLGDWYVDFNQVDGAGSQQGLTEYLLKGYAKQGRKVMYLSIWKAEKLAA